MYRLLSNKILKRNITKIISNIWGRGGLSSLPGWFPPVDLLHLLHREDHGVLLGVVQPTETLGLVLVSARDGDDLLGNSGEHAVQSEQ